MIRYEETDWPGWVAQIIALEPAGCARLYRYINTTARWRLYRFLGPQDVDEGVQEVFVRTVEGLRKRGLRSSSALLGLVRTITGRFIAQHIEGAVAERGRLPQWKAKEEDMQALPGGFGYANYEMFVKRIPERRHNPEQALAAKEMEAATQAALGDLPPHYADVLRRFYLCEQPAPEIMAELQLSATQFRLLKSRAKAQFGEAARVRLAKPKRKAGAAA
jgi:RNA polymerase sigma-70 factor, ECF subfamily